MATTDAELPAVVARPSRYNSISSFISLSGLASLGVGAALYLTSWHIGRKSGDLEKAHQVTKLSDLQHIVHFLPALVAIRGRVASHAPKKCELSDKMAVIHEVVEEEVWRKQRAEGRTVYEPFETRKVFEECEWYLEDGLGPRVKVENALQAERLRSALETQAEFIGEDVSNKSIGKVLMEKAWQMSKHGQRKTERYLPVGAVITAVGELDKNYIKRPGQPSIDNNPPAVATVIAGKSDTNSTSSVVARQAEDSSSTAGGGILGKFPGLLRGNNAQLSEDMPFVLRKPVTGPSYITPLTFDQLKASLSITARNCRWLAMAFGAVGAALILQKAVRRLMQRAHEHRVRMRVAQAEAARKARQAEARKAKPGGSSSNNQAAMRTGGHVDEDHDYQGDREPGTCVICLEERVDMVFTQCGHMCCCVACGIGLDRCPICRIKGRAIKVFKP